MINVFSKLIIQVVIIEIKSNKFSDCIWDLQQALNLSTRHACVHNLFRRTLLFSFWACVEKLGSYLL